MFSPCFPWPGIKRACLGATGPLSGRGGAHRAETGPRTHFESYGLYSLPPAKQNIGKPQQNICKMISAERFRNTSWDSSGITARALQNLSRITAEFLQHLSKISAECQQNLGTPFPAGWHCRCLRRVGLVSAPARRGCG